MGRDLLPGVDRARIIRWIAIWLVIAGILGLCFGGPLIFAGSLGGLVGASGALVGTEGQQAGVALAAASGLLIVYGLAELVLAPIRLVVAWGLYGRKRWSRMGVVIATALGALGGLLGILSGAGFIQSLISLVIDGFLLYLFYTDAGIKEILSN